MSNQQRNEYILKYATKKSCGLEIAPYHSPIAPKRDGWNCLSLDFFETEKLRQNAKLDPDPFVSKNIDKIENVDIIASATEIEEELFKIGLLGHFDYICSSHNFEHLPDPLKFLRGAGSALKPNGFLSMAIPNKRYTFDYSRNLTSTKDILKLYFDKQKKPDPYTIFDNKSSFVDNPGGEISYRNDLRKSYLELINSLNGKDEYIDSHVTVYTPESFIHVMNDLMILNLIPFEIKEFKVSGIEFCVHFENIGHNNIGQLKDKFILRRNTLVRKAFKN
jgi:SAM-dependent methyltransferase